MCPAKRFLVDRAGGGAEHANGSEACCQWCDAADGLKREFWRQHQGNTDDAHNQGQPMFRTDFLFQNRCCHEGRDQGLQTNDQGADAAGQTMGDGPIDGREVACMQKEADGRRMGSVPPCEMVLPKQDHQTQHQRCRKRKAVGKK